MRQVSKLNQTIQRVNAVTEAVGAVAPGADIPVRVAQAITSASFLFKRDSSKHEKLINALQLILSIVGIGMHVFLMFVPSIGIELALNAIDLMYQGTLIAALGHSELASVSKRNSP